MARKLDALQTKVTVYDALLLVFLQGSHIVVRKHITYSSVFSGSATYVHARLHRHAGDASATLPLVLRYSGWRT